MPNTYTKEIEEITEQFDFEKVRNYMAFVGWKYWDSPDTPTIENLKETASGLLERVKQDEIAWTMTGGFRASIDSSKHEMPELSLEFIAVKTSVYV